MIYENPYTFQFDELKKIMRESESFKTLKKKKITGRIIGIFISWLALTAIFIYALLHVSNDSKWFITINDLFAAFLAFPVIKYFLNSRS
ncbi:MAG: hypothetical protein AB9836_05245 [Aminipila sp.]